MQMILSQKKFTNPTIFKKLIWKRKKVYGAITVHIT
jgi:hypothetical protein